MKHLLNNLSEEEKNSIREQHEGGMKLDTSRFRTLLENKSGNVKPLVENEEEEDDLGFASHSGDFDGDDSEDESYDEIFALIDDECVNSKNDDDCVLFLNTIIEYCEDKLYEMGQYGGSDEEELDEMVGVDYMSDELGESSSMKSNRGLERLIEKHSLDQILRLFDNDEDSIDELMSTFEPLGITSYDELVDYKGEDEDFGFAKHSGDFDGDDSETPSGLKRNTQAIKVKNLDF